MGIRQEEFDRVIKYAKGLGINVVRKRYKRNDPGGTYDHESQTIELYEWPGQSYTCKIFIMLHELGHHLDWVHIMQEGNSILLNKAWEREWERRPRVSKPTPKYLRRHIYNSECKAIDYMAVIYKELRLNIPKWKLEYEMALDRWVYLRYYQTGDYPTNKEQKEWKRQWRRKNRK